MDVDTNGDSAAVGKSYTPQELDGPSNGKKGCNFSGFLRAFHAPISNSAPFDQNVINSKLGDNRFDPDFETVKSLQSWGEGNGRGGMVSRLALNDMLGPLIKKGMDRKTITFDLIIEDCSKHMTEMREKNKAKAAEFLPKIKTAVEFSGGIRSADDAENMQSTLKKTIGDLFNRSKFKGKLGQLDPADFVKLNDHQSSMGNIEWKDLDNERTISEVVNLAKKQNLQTFVGPMKKALSDFPTRYHQEGGDSSRGKDTRGKNLVKGSDRHSYRIVQVYTAIRDSIDQWQREDNNQGQDTNDPNNKGKQP
jgi:hypothetical protein